MTPVAGREGRRPTTAGERRREAILEAAAAILARDGFGAVSHRAVAREASVPLASTTYYFASREELVAEAMALLAEGYLVHARALAAAPPDRGALAGRVVGMVAGPPGDDLRARLTTTYERYAQAARSPAVASVAAGSTRELVSLAAAVLAAHGVGDAERAARQAIALVDGLLLTALVEGGDDPTAGVAAELETFLGRLG